MDILTIDGTPLPAPHEYGVALSDLDSAGTGRTEDGLLIRERVRGGVAKITASWSALTTEQCALILTAAAPDRFEVRYFFGETRTAAMYAGERTAALTAAREGQAVWDVTLHLIEF